MNQSSEVFIDDSQIEWEDLGEGVSRKILGWNKQMMMVKVRFEKDAEGYQHEHFHTQITYCLDGVFEFTVGDEVRIISRGDSIYIPPNVRHGVYCKEKGCLIDAFTPAREDFI